MGTRIACVYFLTFVLIVICTKTEAQRISHPIPATNPKENPFSKSGKLYKKSFALNKLTTPPLHILHLNV
jgi:hypothetical protein